MIEIVEGRGVGSGKSYYVTTRIVSHVAGGGTVYYSDTMELFPDKIAAYIERKFGLIIEPDQLVSVPKEEMSRIHEVTPPGTDEMPVLIVMDEAQRYLNAKDHADKSKRPLFEWCCESRHDSNDLIFITQNALNIDNQIRRLVTYITRVRNMTQVRLGGISWPFKQFMVALYDGDAKTLMEKKLIPQDKEIFGLYRSKSMRGSHARLAGVGAIGKRKLQKTKKKKPMKFLVTVAVVIVLGVIGLGYKVMSSRSSVFAAEEIKLPSPVAVEKKVQPVAKKAEPEVKRGYQIKRETFRASTANLVRTLEGGIYEVGTMSGHGMVEAIRGRVVKVRTPENAVLYVVCDDMPEMLFTASTGADGGGSPRK